MITRTTKHISTISDFLDSSDRLSQICKHIEKINELQIKLQKHLEAPLNRHVVIADYQQKTLVLHTDSAAWAAKLRYQTPDILKVFKRDAPGIRTVRIKVMPSDSLSQVTRHAEQVTPETVYAIRQVAEKTGDPALRAILHSIAGNLGLSQPHGSKRSNI